MEIHGECFFFDVGQGTANVILLGDRRALVIDAGPRKFGPAHQILEDYRVESIDCVVLSHNDRDHVLGWEYLAKQFGDRIEDVYLLQDRRIEPGNLLDLTACLAKEGVIPRPRRAEVRDLKTPLTIWEDSERSLKLDLLYPDMLANLGGQRLADPNRTSAIAALRCSGKTLLFPGDSTLEAWRDLASESGDLPLDVEILALPHHGGLLAKNARKADLEWLFGECVHCRVATVSVGSSNPHKHPRPEILEVLRENGVVILCTQITPQCHRALEGLRPGVIAPDDHSLSAQDLSGKSVGCAGTVVATLGSDGVELQREREHRDAVTTRTRSPMCVS